MSTYRPPRIKPEVTKFCQNRGCGCSLTSTDISVGYCTQCSHPIQPQPHSLEFALRASLRRVREAKGNRND